MENHSEIELPKIVWLKGDEDFYESFTFNADEAMDYLNIKRSRLTQISGKELRVGKARIDRYIRALYRKEDLDEYLAWTRPTAAHQKSMDIVEKAASRLDEAQDHWALSLTKAFNNQLQDLSAMHLSLISALAPQLETLRAEGLKTRKGLLFVEEKIPGLFAASQALREDLRALDQRLHLQNLQLEKLEEGLTELGLELRAERGSLAPKLEELRAHIDQKHVALMQELREDLAALSLDLRPAVEPPKKPPRRLPRQRTWGRA